MSTHIFYSTRDLDFLDACQSVLKQNPDRRFGSLLALSAAVSRSQAPSYYVDPDYAYRIVLAIRRNGGVSGSGITRRKWAEFYRKVMTRMECCKNESLREAAMHVAVFEPADSFFISPECGVKILRTHLRRRRSALVPLLPPALLVRSRRRRYRHYTKL
ncbi:MAG: hypothetical protein K1V87_05515 [Muribaculum sp.]